MKAFHLANAGGAIQNLNPKWVYGQLFLPPGRYFVFATMEFWMGSGGNHSAGPFQVSMSVGSSSDYFQGGLRDTSQNEPGWNASVSLSLVTEITQYDSVRLFWDLWESVDEHGAPKAIPPWDGLYFRNLQVTALQVEELEVIKGSLQWESVSKAANAKLKYVDPKNVPGH
jgi:hypothetical protein